MTGPASSSPAAAAAAGRASSDVPRQHRASSPPPGRKSSIFYRKWVSDQIKRPGEGVRPTPGRRSGAVLHGVLIRVQVLRHPGQPPGVTRAAPLHGMADFDHPRDGA
jgi:hypothetical protein